MFIHSGVKRVTKGLALAERVGFFSIGVGNANAIKCKGHVFVQNTSGVWLEYARVCVCG